MQTENCLEAAMFAASENYSNSHYEIEECETEEESEDNTEVIVPQLPEQPYLETWA